MKRIVMLCNYFAPDNKIAAIRITKLAKYFKQYGCEVTVVSEEKQDTVEDELLKRDAEGIRSIRVSSSGRIKRAVTMIQKAVSPLRQRRFDDSDNRMKYDKKSGKYEFFPFETACPFWGSFDYVMDLLLQYDLFRAAKPYLDALEEPDYIFSSYGDYFGIFAGRYLHRKYGKAKWTADFRDGIYQYKFTPKYVAWIAKLFEKSIWRDADCITAVSRGLCQEIPRKYWKKVHCVTNGFDREDRKDICINDNGHNKLRFVYTGGMYGGMRNLSPVFSSIRELTDKKMINSRKIEFWHAGKESAYRVLVSQAQTYGLDTNCIYCGRLPRKESLKLQMESDILVVAAVNSATEKGNLTGKALEYMSAGKPILAIINGNRSNSELGAIIRDAKLGFVYEQADGKKGNLELHQYLLRKYNEFVANGGLKHNPNERKLRKFDYRYLSYKMLRIMMK